MIQALQQPTTFDEFIEWLPETSECRYELHQGAIVEMPKPKGKHSDVAGFPLLRKTLTIPGKDGDDVPLYLEKQLVKLLTALEELGKEENS